MFSGNVQQQQQEQQEQEQQEQEQQEHQQHHNVTANLTSLSTVGHQRLDAPSAPIPIESVRFLAAAGRQDWLPFLAPRPRQSALPPTAADTETNPGSAQAAAVAAAAAAASALTATTTNPQNGNRRQDLQRSLFQRHGQSDAALAPPNAMVENLTSLQSQLAHPKIAPPADTKNQDIKLKIPPPGIPLPSMSTTQLTEVSVPHDNDVLCGRGGGTNNHKGNEEYRNLVQATKLLYLHSSKRDKPFVSKGIVRAVRAQKPPGRFLMKDETTGLWFDIGDQKAREKTSQALREGAPVMRRELYSPGGASSIGSNGQTPTHPTPQHAVPDQGAGTTATSLQAAVATLQQQQQQEQLAANQLLSAQQQQQQALASINAVAAASGRGIGGTGSGALWNKALPSLSQLRQAEGYPYQVVLGGPNMPPPAFQNHGQKKAPEPLFADSDQRSGAANLVAREANHLQKNPAMEQQHQHQQLVLKDSSEQNPTTQPLEPGRVAAATNEAGSSAAKPANSKPPLGRGAAFDIAPGISHAHRNDKPLGTVARTEGRLAASNAVQQNTAQCQQSSGVEQRGSSMGATNTASSSSSATAALKSKNNCFAKSLPESSSIRRRTVQKQRNAAIQARSLSTEANHRLVLAETVAQKTVNGTVTEELQAEEYRVSCYLDAGLLGIKPADLTKHLSKGGRESELVNKHYLRLKAALNNDEDRGNNSNESSSDGGSKRNRVSASSIITKYAKKTRAPPEIMSSAVYVLTDEAVEDAMEAIGD